MVVKPLHQCVLTSFLYNDTITSIGQHLITLEILLFILIFKVLNASIISI